MIFFFNSTTRSRVYYSFDYLQIKMMELSYNTFGQTLN